MRVTRSVSYAVGILLQVAHGGRGTSMTAAKIARDCSFPPRFLYRILRRLVDAGLLTGTSGPGGGYALAKPANKITLLDIVAAVESLGSESPRLEAVRPKYRRAVTKVNELVQQHDRRLEEALRKLTLERLMSP
jgi:Rrf2 family protein